MQILITGGAGFIGSSLAARLLRRGDRVWCVDNFDSYYAPQIKERNIAPLRSDKNFTFCKGDICDRAGLLRIFRKAKPQYVCHLAAKVGVRLSIVHPEEYMKVNIQGTQNVLNASTEVGVRHLIFASSSSVYGNSPQKPFSEKSPCFPVSPYGASKYAAEQLVAAHHRSHQLRATILRFFTVYGPKGRPDMAPYLFVDHIFHNRPITKFGNGQSRRDYTYVDDIVTGILAALEKNHAFDIYNLGAGSPVSLNTFIALIEHKLKKKARITPATRPVSDMIATHADISRAQRLLGYRPKTKLPDGLDRFIHWYLKP